MQALKNGISAIFLSSVLYACGSGGGGGGGGATLAGGGFIDPATCVFPAVTVAITAANAEEVVSEVKGAIQTMLAFANADSTFIDLNNAVIPSNPFVAMCDMGGDATINITTDIAPLGFISEGDVLATNFSNCVNSGETVNGAFTATYNTITEAAAGDAGNVGSAMLWDFNINVVSDNLRVNDSNINVAADGDSTADVIFNAGNLTSLVTNTALTFSDSGGECARVGNANITSTAMNVTTNPAAYTLNVNAMGNEFAVESTEISGLVLVYTSTAIAGMEDLFNVGLGEAEEYFVELDDTMPPNSGVLEIMGNASGATVTLMGGGMVQIVVTDNMGNPVGMPIMTTWAALQ